MKISSRTVIQFKRHTQQSGQPLLVALGLVTLVTGCSSALAQSNQVEASTPITPVLPTLMPTPTPLSPVTNPLFVAPTATTWPTPMALPTPTPWPTPAAWRPALQPLPTLAPLPTAPTAAIESPGGSIAFNYSPPDGVDVFGSTVLRWTFGDQLAADEFFDIRIRPYGSNNSAFVAWSKTPEFELHPWSGWQPGLYTWQIGIVKGYLEGENKHFVADTGRNSQPFLVKWQAAGGGGGGSAVSGGGGGGGGGGGKSGGS